MFLYNKINFFNQNFIFRWESFKINSLRDLIKNERNFEFTKSEINKRIRKNKIK